MKSILGFFISWMLLHDCISSIIVVNKLNRKTYLTIQHDLLLSGLEQPILKAQLHFVQLSKTCSIPKLPQSKLYSLHSTNANRQIVLIVQADNDDCDVSGNILEAKKIGYSGIIFGAHAIPRFRNIKPIQGFYAAVISNDDRFRLTQFNATRYKVSIFRDTSVLEDVVEYLRRLLEWLIPSINNVVAGIQILLVLTPLFVLLAVYLLASQRPNYHQSYQTYDQSYQSRDQPYRNWEDDDDYNSSESVSYANGDDMLEFRKILNVGQNAGQKEIERAFRDRAFVLHPDKNVNLEKEERLNREEELKKCQTAKEALLDALHSKSKMR